MTAAVVDERTDFAVQFSTFLRRLNVAQEAVHRRYNTIMIEAYGRTIPHTQDVHLNMFIDDDDCSKCKGEMKRCMRCGM